MKRSDDDALAKMVVSNEWGKALGIAVLVAALPGVLLFCVPPLLALATGLAFIPFMYVLMRRRLMSERATIAELVDATRPRVVDPAHAAAALDEVLWTNADAAAAEATAAFRRET